MRVKVYAKSAVDMTAKIGVFTYYFVREGEIFNKTLPFSQMVKTWAQADCAAYINALHFFTTLEAMQACTELEIITDSGVVEDLLKTYKAQKHCEDISKFWREKIQSELPLTTKIVVRKFAGTIRSGDMDSTYLLKCSTEAQGALKKQKDKLL